MNAAASPEVNGGEAPHEEISTYLRVHRCLCHLAYRKRMLLSDLVELLGHFAEHSGAYANILRATRVIQGVVCDAKRRRSTRKTGEMTITRRSLKYEMSPFSSAIICESELIWGVRTSSIRHRTLYEAPKRLDRFGGRRIRLFYHRNTVFEHFTGMSHTVSTGITLSADVIHFLRLKVALYAVSAVSTQFYTTLTLVSFFSRCSDTKG